MFHRLRSLGWVPGLIVWVGMLSAQTDAHRIHISDIDRVIHKNWMGLPRTVDCTVTWEVFARSENGWDPTDVSIFDSFKAYCRPFDSEGAEWTESVDGNFSTFQGLEIGQTYAFFVEGFHQGQEVLSDTASITAGKEMRAAVAGTVSQWHNWIPLNGRIPMAFVGRGYVYDGATKAGKIAFHIIWNFFLAGMIIWVFYCQKHLGLGRIFPMKGRLNIAGSFDAVYRQSVTDEFTSIIETWRELVESANDHMRDSLGSGSQTSIREMETSNIEFWREEGAKKVRDLLERVNHPSLNHYPAVKIIRAGLENHEFGGYRWLEVSKEVDRAIENRASSELERLRRSSLMDWLWNLGTLGPLIGLFGTATGISHAFATLTMLRADITQTTLVRRLAEGIFEALWTTIEGLFVGVMLMLLFYYYQNKLNWIYSKWEEIYVHVSEKL